MFWEPAHIMKKIVFVLSIVLLSDITSASWKGWDYHGHHGHHGHYGNHGHNHHQNDNSDIEDIRRPWSRHYNQNKPDHYEDGSDDSGENSDGEFEHSGYGPNRYPGHNGNTHWHPWITRTTPENYANPDAPVVTAPIETSRSASPQWSWIQESTTKPSNEQTLAACLASCPVTSEYNPICGTNGVTYNNPARLECAKNCGVNVAISRLADCSVRPQRNLTTTSILECLGSCPVPIDFVPVCGTNNVTYSHPSRLQCAKQCGVAVQVSKFGPCYRYPDGSNLVTKHEQEACHKACPANSENKPVCGTNNVTYKNSESLQCARQCGIDVNIRNVIPCSTTSIDGLLSTTESSISKSSSTPKTNESWDITTESSTPSSNKDTTEPTTPTLKEVIACMQMCPLTSEYLPICGTDGITYTNPGRLLCSQFCGIDVNVKKWSPCEGQTQVNFECPKYNTTTTTTVPIPLPLTREDCLLSCPIVKNPDPVCGSDNITYVNIADLECSKNCGFDVYFKYKGPCTDDRVTSSTEKDVVTPTQPTSDQSTEATSSSTTSSSNFTIPSDLLNQIFGTRPSPTQPTSTDDDFDVDERYNDK